MKSRSFLTSCAFFFSSVRLRLTLWYLAFIAFLMCLFGGSLYGTQAYLSSDAINARLDTQLYQDAQQLRDVYRTALLRNVQPNTQTVQLSSNEFVLLLEPDTTMLDMRGTLPANIIQQLQMRAEGNQTLFDISIPDQGSSSSGERRGWSWNWHSEPGYRILMTPVLNGQERVGVLFVGLPHSFSIPIVTIWMWHGFMGLLVAAIGGYWLAGKSLRPVKMITRTANEINATDLRRRLNLKRRDEFGELAATFDQMLARLEAAFKQQARFTADASHELRTPLTIINLEINQALTQASTPEEYQQALEQIQVENEQMAAIVNSLLLLARADAGQIALQQEEVDLSDIALASVERLLPLAQRKDITISTGELPELIVQGDPHHLGSMLTNLIENAIKYTSGIGKHVHVELAREGERAVARVRDDGPGIASDHLPFLFDRFYRVDKARTQKGTEEPGGTGLGLAIAQWIVQTHHGEIRVHSTIGSGSLFEVYLPLQPEGAAKPELTCDNKK
ncbi:sensor histidine kinase [Ktedonospora formicarum]|uniref:histidine kinase n=1 Tax=Ktedonospora formicarum TaxID=2778364 RepID=A0A8J3I3R3_9CHLR|nr:HAMP domain-containing sensor histidine kinase [Ktedonospora formicarum]GHO49622.1 two-component sensor histidine kinase [Ktedonospora formicarum]